MATAVTGPDGTFTLKNAPERQQHPAGRADRQVAQKEILVPQVTSCAANARRQHRAPKNLTDGAYASLPNIAVSTGGADTLECLLTRVGVDEAMFTGSPTGTGGGSTCSRAPAVTPLPGSLGPRSASLWDRQADLSRYDIIMLSCEGARHRPV